MKKSIACLLIVILCLSFTVSLAAKPPEALFQEIPWYSSPGEAIQILYQKDFLDENDKSTKRMIDNIDGVSLRDSKSYLESSSENKKMPYAYNSNRNNALSTNLKHLRIGKKGIKKTIAKQEITEIDLQFWDDNGELKLVECAINFNTDLDAKELYNALAKIYGKPKATMFKTQRALWYGDNNTVVLKSYSHIIFATLDGINSSMASVPEEPEKEDADF